MACEVITQTCIDQGEAFVRRFQQQAMCDDRAAHERTETPAVEVVHFHG